ncbi:putative selenate ABC transporter substrate-binding protein [Blastococcus brunescens]|uniref:Selenate ABC transporter substrate-binding protein n=1 Tax=Blastococcus brunescens TaxID=1564165 RepID=A0ABZ1B458_9ACTN|nr:putative selenate ABC transporter substrate-binding protein [Blastococcus sp. BMG 8361]WRL65576.1 putative selenate ABC transporter substrate-binding protein [Blastococcus sp. BMG 8361]
MADRVPGEDGRIHRRPRQEVPPCPLPAPAPTRGRSDARSRRPVGWSRIRFPHLLPPQPPRRLRHRPRRRPRRLRPPSPVSASPDPAGPLRIGAIPDQDPEVLQRLYGTVADSLSDALQLDVSYEPVTDYAAAVSLFRTGDLDLVWFGGLTGVQARLRTPGAVPIAQRDIDAAFHSVFVVNAATGLAPSDDLTPLAGRRFTYGSETSTSGRLMPAFFLQQQGVDPSGFPGGPGFSGSHDATLALVASGTYEAGVLNEQVWRSRTEEGAVDPAVMLYARTPAYHDYHWLLAPSAVDRLGADLPSRLTGYFTGLAPDDPDDAVVLELFGADSFIATEAANYEQIEAIGRDLGLIN